MNGLRSALAAWYSVPTPGRRQLPEKGPGRMAQEDIQLGFLTLWLPTVCEPRCLIMHDLAEAFGTELNRDAASLLNTSWPATPWQRTSWTLPGG